MPEEVGTDSRTLKFGPLRNSGRRISLAFSSGSSSNEFLSPGAADSSFCPKHETIVLAKINNQREAVRLNYLSADWPLRRARPIHPRLPARFCPDYIAPFLEKF